MNVSRKRSSLFLKLNKSRMNIFSWAAIALKLCCWNPIVSPKPNYGSTSDFVLDLFWWYFYYFQDLSKKLHRIILGDITLLSCENDETKLLGYGNVYHFAWSLADDKGKEDIEEHIQDLFFRYVCKYSLYRENLFRIKILRENDSSRSC